MSVQNEPLQPVVVDQVVKLEPDELEGGLVTDERRAGDDIPCVSTVPVQAGDNSAYYFPTQAVLTPRSSFPVSTSRGRFSNVRAMQKWTHKRKTIEAIAQGALMNASEPTQFEETIANACTKIAVFDNQTKMEVPRKNVKESLQKLASRDPKYFPKISNCYTLQSDKQYTNSLPTKTVGLATVTLCTVSSSTSTPSMMGVYNKQSSATATVTQPAITMTPETTPRPSLLNSPSTSVLARLLQTRTATKAPVATPETTTIIQQQLPATSETLSLSTRTTPSPASSPNVRVVPYSSVRPEVPKTAVCLPNNVLKQQTKEAPTIVYVPKEIKIGSMELQLDDCVNVRAICDKELTKWTAEDVAKFVRATDCSEYADAFIDQEIDGKALTLLNQELLIQWMKLKLGPAMKLYSHIVNLKHALQNIR